MAKKLLSLKMWWQLWLDFIHYVKSSLREAHIYTRRPLDPDKPIVLLLYGFFANPRSFRVLEERLHRLGYSVMIIDFGGFLNVFNTRGIPQLAEQIRREMIYIMRTYGFRRFTIISHSKGGLIGRYYIKRLGGHKYVPLLITMGTPHHGTPYGYYGYLPPMQILAPSLKQMAPMSRFVRKLKRGQWPSSTHLISIYSRSDRLALYPSPVLETNDPQLATIVRNIEVSGVSHTQFPRSKRVFDVIAELVAEFYQVCPLPDVAQESDQQAS